MARFVFGLNQSLDGYVDHAAFSPDPVLFRHFTDQVRGLAGSVYGRRTYEVLRYWDGDDAGWGQDEREFAAAWRQQPKWIVSRTLRDVGPNATLIDDNVEAAIRQLRDRTEGEMQIGGPELAHFLTALGLVDEYRIYLSPVVLGQGKPFFAGARPPLLLTGADRIGDAVIRLTYGNA